jgi:hypothetical protein
MGGVIMKTALLLVLSSLLGACGSDVAPVNPPTPDGPPEPPPTPFTECDSEPTAYIRDAFLAITGRRPHGQAEIEVYHSLWTKAEEQGLDPRKTISTALTNAPEFASRWESVLMDAVRVQRTNAQNMVSCWGTTGGVPPGTNLAVRIRDSNASLTLPEGQATMLDVTRSALELDDISTIYRAQLFNLTSLPPGTANASPEAAELSQRADLGATFDSAWLRRDAVCLGCHNSQASVTDSDDPALDRHWPVAGLPENQVYGAIEPNAGTRAHGVFRISGFVGFGGHTPWGMSSSCGQFADPNGNLGNDIANIDTKLGSITGKRTTVYDLDAALKRGFDRLRGHGPTLVDGAIQDPDEALAWLVTLSMAEEMWREIVGSPLTIANGFPRNAAASELLSSLATELALSSYSLKHLVIQITTTDFFSRKAPEAGCGTPYSYPAVYDPWTTSEQDAAKRGNGPGDAIAWLAPRSMAIAASGALWNGTPLIQAFPSDGGSFCTGTCEDLTNFCDQFAVCCEEAAQTCAGEPPTNVDSIAFHRSVGVYLRNSEPGFRGLSFQARLAWEDRFASCSKPDGAPDFVDELIATAATKADATAADLVLAVKDRIINEPVIQPGEEGPLAALLGPLTTPAASVDSAALRHYCGVLLASPQFTLSGLPGRDGEVPLLTPASAQSSAVCNRLNDVSIGGGKHVECTADAISIAAD